MAASAGMSGRFEHFDARPGGSYRMILEYDDPHGGKGKSTAAADVVEVRFVDIVEQVRVVQAVDFVSDDPSFDGTMTITWEIEPAAEGSRIHVRAEGVPVGISPDDHVAGMASSLENLAEYVESRGA